MQIAAVEEGFQDDRHTADVVHVFREIPAAGLEVGQQRGARKYFGHVEQVEHDTGFVREGRQVQCGVRAATGCGHDRGGIFQRLARDDFTRARSVAQQAHDRLAGQFGVHVTRLEHRRRTGRTGQGKSDRFRHVRHAVGGVLSAAGAGTGAGDFLEGRKLLKSHLAGGVFTHSLEHVEHGDVASLEPTRHDRAAVQEHRRHVESHHGHHEPGQRFVAAANGDQRIVAMATHRELDRVGNRFATHQRRLHAGVSHRDAVGHGDRGEFTRCATGGRDAALGRFRLPSQ